jgi:hypothetical protein
MSPMPHPFRSIGRNPAAQSKRLGAATRPLESTTLKLLAILLNLLTVLAPFGKAEEPDPLKKEFAELAEKIAPAETLLRWNKVVLHPETAESKGQLEVAQKALAEAKANIPKLRTLLKPGKSVFDYPGLLALGRITHSGIDFASKASPEYTYRLYIGAHFGGGEGIHAFDFTVTFNQRATAG